MRQLHAVAAHEKFVASGVYTFARDGEAMPKTERFTTHELGDGGRLTRVDMDARLDEGKSLLLHALHDSKGALQRFDLRYHNERYEGGVKSLGASYQFDAARTQVGYAMNRAARDYVEMELPQDVLIDMPLLCLRGLSLMTLARREGLPTPLFVPMYEFASLFPGIVTEVVSPVEALGEDLLTSGNRAYLANRFRYRDKAASYWVDAHGTIIKRISAFKQREFVVELRDYARRAE